MTTPAGFCPSQGPFLWVALARASSGASCSADLLVSHLPSIPGRTVLTDTAEGHSFGPLFPDLH